MPHKDRENNTEELPSERRQRLKSEKDANRPHKSSRSSRPKVIDPETGEPIRSSHRRRKDKEMNLEPGVAMDEIAPELSKTSSAPEMTSRESLPYPSFSKAHSREAVNSKDDIKIIPTSRPADVYTPEPTDLGSGDTRRTKSADPSDSQRKGKEQDSRPLTPPDTEISPQRKTTPSSIVRERKSNESQERPSSQTSQRSWFGRPRERDEKSRLSTKSRGSIKSKGSKTSTAIRTSKAKAAKVATVEDATSNLSDEESISAIDSNATSIPKRETPALGGHSDRPPTLDPDVSPESSHSSSPRTPIATPKFPHDFKPTPSPFVSFDVSDSQDEAYDSPQPPPPPPPPNVPIVVPRVDYLMQNGGISRTIPKNLLAITPVYSNLPQDRTRISTIPGVNVEKVFGPFHNLLEQYETVINKGGSVAVATGYRSVARRLLDRLENVFARDLSSEGCSCVMCQQYDRGTGRGLGWGEVLEWVSDRRDLPAYPAFDFSTMGVDHEELAALGITDANSKNAARPPRPRSPVKIDPDIAEEFHQHYLRQSKKTKHAVANWLSSTPSAAGGLPADIDDETLTFTILTHLNPEERPTFNALLAGSPRPINPTSRAPTPGVRPRTDFIVKTGLSLQRLYRLPAAPRDPEACIYLLRNPEMHNLLATLSGINNSEWEILTSGRFDGFLWSGAETEFPNSMLNSPAISRGPTPANGLPSRGPTPAQQRHPSISRITSPLQTRANTFSPITGFPSRGPTPASFAGGISVPPTPLQGRHPVSNDEEAEIAVLAEVEREIYVGMEALEDAFEALHRKAEFVRRALRERGAGLSMAAQTRISAIDGGAFARLGTPGFDRGWNANGTESEAASESDWGGDDTFSELAPDDSASNISSSRIRRPKRRNERRTPAPVEEADEESEN